MGGKVLAYDSKEGIEGYLNAGVEGLHKLETDRHKAGYDRKERLQEWCILGRWMADSCGNFGKIINRPSMGELVPAEVLRNCPRVMAKDDACKLVERICWDGMRSHIPHPGMVCERCGVTWNINDVHDAIEFNDHIKVNCEPFIGMELELFERSIVSNIRYSRLFGEFLRNDRFIDMSPYDEKFKDMPKNKNGWVGKKELAANYRFKHGDEVLVTYFFWRHEKCHQKAVDEADVLGFKEAFQKAGFVGFVMLPVPNQYWPSGIQFAIPSWHNVATEELGRITIGWRKRVINIDWKESEILKSVDTKKLFEKEEVTKDKTFIHAWGYEKAIEYLAILRAAAINRRTT